MLYTHMFSYNIPFDNHSDGKTDDYINVIAKWHSDHLFSDGDPMFTTSPVNLSFYDCPKIKDWYAAIADINSIAKNHFTEIARQEKINQARAVLAMNENPILERMELKLTDPLY